jgi:hypothetical protein
VKFIMQYWKFVIFAVVVVFSFQLAMCSFSMVTNPYCSLGNRHVSADLESRHQYPGDLFYEREMMAYKQACSADLSKDGVQYMNDLYKSMGLNCQAIWRYVKARYGI